MQIVSIDELVVPEERVRKTFVQSDIDDLADSIERFGLFHAPVVQNDGQTLLVGERRYRAISQLAEQGKGFRYNDQQIEPGQMPVVTIGDFTKDDLLEVEIDENVKRVQLTWQEKSQALAALHELRKSQKEAQGEKQYYHETAEELEEEPSEGRSSKRNDVRDSVILNQWLDDPEVAKAKSSKDAMKIVEKKLEKKKREALAREYDLGKTKASHQILSGDLREILPTLDAEQFDCIIADPPYGVNADKFRNQNAERHEYQDDEDYANDLMNVIASEGWRVTKKQAHIYVCCDIRRFADVKELFEAAGWYVFKTPLIWYKGPRMGLLPLAEHGPRRCYEAIMYAIKGERKTLHVAPDVVDAPHDASVERGAHKPPELYANLLARTCYAGNKVLDPCCGTGPVFKAADDMRCIATGIEVDEAALGWAIERLKGDEDDG